MHLSPADAALFYKLMFALQFYVNQTLVLHPNVPSLAAYQDLDQQAKLLVRNAVYADPGLIERFVTDNPAQLPTTDLAIVAKWENFVAGDFYIERYLPQGSIWIASQPPAYVYRVLGLTHSLEAMVSRFDLPRQVNSVLLPFKGHIVYDGLLSTHQNLFGGGIRAALRDEYIAAKQQNRIIESLE